MSLCTGRGESCPVCVYEVQCLRRLLSLLGPKKEAKKRRGLFCAVWKLCVTSCRSICASLSAKGARAGRFPAPFRAWHDAHALPHVRGSGERGVRWYCRAVISRSGAFVSEINFSYAARDQALLKRQCGCSNPHFLVLFVRSKKDRLVLVFAPTDRSNEYFLMPPAASFFAWPKERSKETARLVSCPTPLPPDRPSLGGGV